MERRRRKQQLSPAPITPHGQGRMELLAYYGPFALWVSKTKGFQMNLQWWKEQGSPGRKTWVVDRAGNLAELERKLNHLEEEKFRIHWVFANVDLAFFVILGFQREPSRPWL